MGKATSRKTSLGCGRRLLILVLVVVSASAARPLAGRQAKDGSKAVVREMPEADCTGKEQSACAYQQSADDHAGQSIQSQERRAPEDHDGKGVYQNQSHQTETEIMLNLLHSWFSFS